MIFGTGNIFAPKQPRQADATDTRQAIQRHEQDQRRKKNQDDDREKEDFFDMDDQARVSVSALRTFLGNYLYNSKPKDADQTQLTEIEPTPESETEPETGAGSEPQENAEQLPAQSDFDAHQAIEEPASSSPPRSAAAAHAANAYKTMAEKTDRRAAPRSSVDSAEAEKLGLTAEDTRVIHELLNDLRALSSLGIETIAIERGDSFLESLRLAVEKEKLRLSR